MTPLILNPDTRFSSFISFKLQPFYPHTRAPCYAPNMRGRNCDKRKIQLKQRYGENRISSISIKPKTCISTELYRDHVDKAHLLTLSRSSFRSCIQHDDGYVYIAETCSYFDVYDESCVQNVFLIIFYI